MLELDNVCNTPCPSNCCIMAAAVPVFCRRNPKVSMRFAGLARQHKVAARLLTLQDELQTYINGRDQVASHVDAAVAVDQPAEPRHKHPQLQKQLKMAKLLQPRVLELH